MAKKFSAYLGPILFVYYLFFVIPPYMANKDDSRPMSVLRVVCWNTEAMHQKHTISQS